MNWLPERRGMWTGPVAFGPRPAVPPAGYVHSSGWTGGSPSNLVEDWTGNRANSSSPAPTDKQPLLPPVAFKAVVFFGNLLPYPNRGVTQGGMVSPYWFTFWKWIGLVERSLRKVYDEVVLNGTLRVVKYVQIKMCMTCKQITCNKSDYTEYWRFIQVINSHLRAEDEISRVWTRENRNFTWWSRTETLLIIDADTIWELF
jgi:hypothetical protein